MCGEEGADDMHCLDGCSGYEALIPGVDDFTYRYYTVRNVCFGQPIFVLGVANPYFGSMHCFFLKIPNLNTRGPMLCLKKKKNNFEKHVCMRNLTSKATGMCYDSHVTNIIVVYL